MDDTRKEIAPTDSAALYKNMTTTVRPSIDHKHLEFIESYNGERIIFGAFNLNGRQWGGSIWVYEDSSNFERSKIVACWLTESVASDAVFIDRDKFIIVGDSGALQILEIVDFSSTQSKDVRSMGSTCQHDDSILSISMFHSKNRVVTGGMDRCIKVWNVEELLAEHSYPGAHTKFVTSVHTKPNSDDIFASAGYGDEIVTWDVRQRKPAKVVYSRSDQKFVAVAWCPDDENILTVGSIDGSLKLLDIRSPQLFTAHSNIFNRSVRRIKFDPKRPNLLAACCEDTPVKILDTRNDFSVVYEDNRHEDFVRGISWNKEELLTCSWDNTVLTHDISKVLEHYQ